MTDSELLAELQRLRAQFDQQSAAQADALRKLQSAVDHQTVTAAAAAVAPPGQRQPMDYRAALRSNPESSLVSGWLGRAQTNNTLPSNGLSSGSSPAPQRVLREDLQLIIRGTTASLTNPLRDHPDEVVKRANRTIKDACDAAKPKKIAPIRASTGFVLPSGDVLLRCDSVADVRQLVELDTPDESWCAVFGPKSHLKLPTFAVVAHGVPLDFEPTAADAANSAIRLGLALNGRDHDCQFFDGSHRLQQCFHCQMYGHIARNCRRQAQCAYCAGLHDSKECTQPRNHAAAKCAVCIRFNETATDRVAVNHFAYERECPRRAEKLELLRISRAQGPVLHRTPSTASSPAASSLSASLDMCKPSPMGRGKDP
ncbi:hypothetical protein N7466_006672 [Penicillium verhagenii]|uniref:uncharacterized protein n=1 Tax=Penicillium verhagenii TaxID=1562060 RepID=UPI002545AEE5|nr:uncharacterized protein N7466_006672 [Penicillium verhagenii]KAJ5927716.1 hypothetical protein N7466_006672 [Penicillium verhagenii]